MTSDGEALFRSICEEPRDDTRRLAYADWLEENGDPDRAAFIRLQIELERASGDRSGRRETTPREQEMLVKHRRKWVRGQPRGAGVQWWPDFVGGFPHGVSFRYARRFADRADEVFGWAPVDSVAVRLVTARTIETLLGVPYLSRLTYLSVEGAYGDAGAERLARCEHLAHLTRLDVSSMLTEAGLLALARSPHLGELRELAVSGWYTDSGALALADSPHLARVQSLRLMGVNRLSPSTVGRLRKRFTVGLWV